MIIIIKLDDLGLVGTRTILSKEGACSHTFPIFISKGAFQQIEYLRYIVSLCATLTLHTRARTHTHTHTHTLSLSCSHSLSISFFKMTGWSHSDTNIITSCLVSEASLLVSLVLRSVWTKPGSRHIEVEKKSRVHSKSLIEYDSSWRSCRFHY